MVVETEEILGFGVTTLTADRVAERIQGWIDGGARGHCLVCANPHSLEVARRDGAFGEAIRTAHLVVPDGIGVVLASRILGGAIRERVTGSDVFHGLSRRLNARGGYRYFFLGSTEENLAAIGERMGRDYPAIGVAGSYSPPFRDEFSDEESAVMAGRINGARPDVLWVGMTAPKQEKWIHGNLERLDVPFIGAIGAVFDFYTGRVKRSHPAFQRIGLEWLPRLLQEPGRLWRRNLVSNPRFMMRVLAARIAR